MKKLVGFGGDADLVDNNKQTPIYYAIKGNKADVVEYLLQHGANFNNVDNKGTTPYQFAKKSNKASIVEILKKHNAIPESELAGKQGKDKKVPQA